MSDEALVLEAPVVHGVRVKIIKPTSSIVTAAFGSDYRRHLGKTGVALRVSENARNGYNFIVLALDDGPTISLPSPFVVRADNGGQLL